MRVVVTVILILLLFIIGCWNDSGVENDERYLYTLQAYPLCDFLVGEDSGGQWKSVSVPAGSTLTQNDLVGDCPNIDFDLYGCGQYVLRYIVESTTCTNCKDSTDITINKCCLQGSANCN